ncbi:hypothetical protein Tco_1073179 [Tanacetum coccineum]
MLFELMQAVFDYGAVSHWNTHTMHVRDVLVCLMLEAYPSQCNNPPAAAVPPPVPVSLHYVAPVMAQAYVADIRIVKQLPKELQLLDLEAIGSLVRVYLIVKRICHLSGPAQGSHLDKATTAVESMQIQANSDASSFQPNEFFDVAGQHVRLLEVSKSALCMHNKSSKLMTTKLKADQSANIDERSTKEKADERREINAHELYFWFELRDIKCTGQLLDVWTIISDI